MRYCMLHKAEDREFGWLQLFKYETQNKIMNLVTSS